MPDIEVPVRKHRSLAEKQAIVAEVERRMRATGRGVKPVAGQMGIAVSTFYMWLRQCSQASRAQGVCAPVAKAHETRGTAWAMAPGSSDASERARILAAIRAGLANGVPIKVTARQHGITEGVFYRWAREAGRGSVGPSAGANAPSQALVVSASPAPAFRSVTLTSPEPARALSLVAPSGHRIEGLSVETAAALLRALS